MHKALILIIDRDPETRAMYADYFRYHGYRVAEVSDAAEGVGLYPYPELRPNLVITELSDEPEWLEALRALRLAAPGRRTPVLVCSSRIDPRVPLAPPDLDVDVALPKPTTPEALLIEAQQVLARRVAAAWSAAPAA